MNPLLSEGAGEVRGAQKLNPPHRWLIGCTVLGLTSFCVFVLPLLVPVRYVPAISASYVAGFNNRVAAVAAALIAVLSLLAGWRWPSLRGMSARRMAGHRGGYVGLPVFASVTLLSWAFYALCGVLLSQMQIQYLSDGGYFMQQIGKHVVFGSKLYRDIEFAYGPLLFFPAAWLQQLLHCKALPAYFLTLAITEAAGLLELAYLLVHLPLSRRTRQFAFVLIGLGALNPLLGLNYTLFRFLTPFVVLVYAARVRSTVVRALCLLLGQILCLSISAEIGVAFCAGALVLVAWQAWQVRWTAVWMGLGPLFGAGIFVKLMGSDYLLSLQSFSRGALNLPVGPYPHILVFLMAATWLVPRFVSAQVRTGSPDAPALLACFGASLGLIPVVLGRCDPLHVFFNGAALFLLSLAAVEHMDLRARRIWWAALLFLVLWQEGINNWLFRYRTAEIFSETVMPHLPARVQDAILRMVGPNSDMADTLRVGPEDPDEGDYTFDLARFHRDVGDALVATPLEIMPETQEALQHSHHLMPDYYAYLMNVFDATSMARKLAEMNHAEWALVPKEIVKPFVEAPDKITVLQGMYLPYPVRHAAPFDPGAVFEQSLHQRWRVADELGPYYLVRRIH